MVEFRVDDMTCGGCASRITKAVKGATPAASVDINLAAHRVRVQGSGVVIEDIEAAIRDAGYTPARV